MEKGSTMSEEQKRKISETLRGRKRPPFSEEWKQKIGEASKSRGFSENAIRKMSEARKGKTLSEEHKHKIGKSSRERWQDPLWRNKTIRKSRKATSQEPNKSESLMLKYLNSINPGEWKYVGDGELIIGGKNPDFMNTNGKKLVGELYGDYWHQGQDPQERINHFKKYGFTCIVMWESELKKIYKGGIK